MKKRKWIWFSAIAGVVAMGVVALRFDEPSPPGELVSVTQRLQGVMGTSDVLLRAVVTPGERTRARSALQDAEIALRRVEAQMSRRINGSEIARLNAAPADEAVELSPQTREVLGLAEQVWRQSDGAFDVTVRPLIRLWTDADRRDKLPTPAAIQTARDASRWEQIGLTDGGAIKTAATASVDLGGIAKGYGIDRAVAALQDAGCRGGLVDVGGDIRCFGSKGEGTGPNAPWRVAIRNPLQPDGADYLGVLELHDHAVCTSGNYFRFSEIAGRRYSHILDPRTGRPAEAAPSVTVVASRAVVADAWATALSVLGPDGLSRLPEGVEAMVVTGSPEEVRPHMTPGFADLLAEPLTVPLAVQE